MTSVALTSSSLFLFRRAFISADIGDAQSSWSADNFRFLSVLKFELMFAVFGSRGIVVGVSSTMIPAFSSPSYWLTCSQFRDRTTRTKVHFKCDVRIVRWILVFRILDGRLWAYVINNVCTVSRSIRCVSMEYTWHNAYTQHLFPSCQLSSVSTLSSLPRCCQVPKLCICFPLHAKCRIWHSSSAEVVHQSYIDVLHIINVRRDLQHTVHSIDRELERWIWSVAFLKSDTTTVRDTGFLNCRCCDSDIIAAQTKHTIHLLRSFPVDTEALPMFGNDVELDRIFPLNCHAIHGIFLISVVLKPEFNILQLRHSLW